MEHTTFAALDEDDLFGRSIGASLKKMTDQQKALAKMKIQRLMYETKYCPSPLSDSSLY